MKKEVKELYTYNKDLLQYNRVVNLITLIEEQNNEIQELNYQNFELKQQLKNSKEKICIEFIKELLFSCEKEIEHINNDYKEIEKRDLPTVMKNLINYINEFIKDNKIK